MKPTVTISAWNYCQIRCTYCVSGSNCGLYQIDRVKTFPKSEITDFDASLKWIDKFRPGAAIHILGGEPLLRPDIVDCVKKCLTAGHSDLSIFSNGLALYEKIELLELPLKWCLTYHQDCGMEFQKWISLVEPIREKKHVLHTVISKMEHMKTTYEIKKYCKEYGWNFHPRFDRNAQQTPIPGLKMDEMDDIASRQLTLIIPDGTVYPCSHVAAGPIGNVFDMSCDDDRARLTDPIAKQCAENNACSAYHSAALLDMI